MQQALGVLTFLEIPLDKYVLDSLPVAQILLYGYCYSNIAIWIWICFRGVSHVFEEFSAYARACFYIFL